ncbi:MAG: hypothetical protein ABIR57_11325 [Aeromicrobium sp.]
MDDQRGLTDSVTLEHLIVVPRGGLGNGLRAVGAARRLCSVAGAKLTIVWEFGNYTALFEPDPDVEVLDRVPPYAASLRHIRMPLFSEGGTSKNRRVPICEDAIILVESWFWFCASEEPLVYERNALVDWLPQPAKAIQDTVREFADAHFLGGQSLGGKNNGGRTVGMHIRSGDNGTSVVTTPLEAYIAEADRVIEEGDSIFLATDSAETERTMIERFGDRIIVFPKGWDLPFRWPRLTASSEEMIPDWLEHQLRAGNHRSGVVDTDLAAAGEELVPDFIDMQLLAACDHVIGSQRSSFGQMAVRYNGSPLCRLLAAPPVDPVLGKNLGPVQRTRTTGTS